MASVNKVILVGHLGSDPEARRTPGGASVVSFSVATNENWISKSGEKNERTEWHKIVVWGKLADICSQYLTKGKQVYLEGRLQTRSWQDKDGIKRYTTEITATNMVMLGRSDNGAGRTEVGAGRPDIEQGSQDGQPSGYDQVGELQAVGDDDIPF